MSRYKKKPNKKQKKTDERLKNNLKPDMRHASHQEDTIEAARATINKKMILNKLQMHITGDKAEHTGLSATQIKAAEILLKKSMPDLSSVSVGNADGQPLIVQWEK